MKLRAFALFPVALVVTACTSIIGLKDLPPPAPEVKVDAALAAGITSFATAYCKQFTQCQRGIFDLSFGDLDECVGSIAKGQTLVAANPGTALVPSVFEDCATNVAALPCDRFASTGVDYACILKGSRELGEACIVNAQCKTGFCGSDGSTCRGCVSAPENGGTCAPGVNGGQCGPGYRCSSTNICVADGMSGSGCGPDQPCAIGLGCVEGKCGPLPSTVTAPCDTASGGCDTSLGFLCKPNNDTSTVGVCVRFGVAPAPGGTCGIVDSTYKLCRRFAGCTFPNLKATQGTCGAPPGEGDACSPDGPHCLYPLQCLTDHCATQHELACETQ